MSDWEFIKRRTAAEGAVWRSADGLFYKRTGGVAVRDEADFQLSLARLGYPVPQIVKQGTDGGTWYFVERSVGVSLHDQALARAGEGGLVPDSMIRAAGEVSARLLEAQCGNRLPSSPADVRAWFERAGWVANVREENPDLDTPRTRAAIADALSRLRDVALCRSHLDYGLPNAFAGGVIDWQHHGNAPLGYDVYPMLDIAAFKGGNRGYRFTDDQRAAYVRYLDEITNRLIGQSLSAYQGEFLLVKCFFFLALMRPSDSRRPDKRIKWKYRRTLFEIGLEQYESSRTIRTESFPSLADFRDRLR